MVLRVLYYLSLSSSGTLAVWIHSVPSQVQCVLGAFWVTARRQQPHAGMSTPESTGNINGGMAHTVL